MFARITATVALVGASVLAAPTAQAATVDLLDRRAFDSAPVVTASGYTMEGATAGELGGYLTLSVQATDGTVPGAGKCEPADVEAVLTVAPAETFTVSTTGELCGHFVDGSPTLNAYFGAKQTTYSGTHRRARVSNGLIAFRNSFLGAQGSINMTVRW